LTPLKNYLKIERKKEETMKLKEIIDKDLVKIGIEAKDKEGVLDELLGVIEKKFKITNREDVKKKLLEREAVKSTGLGNGIAIPHAHSEFVEGIAACIGISEEGVEFTCLDGKPAYVFVMIVANPQYNLKYLSLLAHTARILSREDIRQKLIDAKNEEEVIRIIKEFEG